MLSLRTHVLICASLFAAIVILAGTGNALIAAGVLKQPATPSIPAMIGFFGLFLAFGFSAVPVMVMLVMRGQAALGNDRVELVRQAIARQKLIIWAIWALMLAGCLIAIPAAILGGMFR